MEFLLTLLQHTAVKPKAVPGSQVPAISTLTLVRDSAIATPAAVAIYHSLQATVVKAVTATSNSHRIHSHLSVLASFAAPVSELTPSIPTLPETPILVKLTNNDDDDNDNNSYQYCPHL